MNIPQSVAIIMDGNGRWAKAQGKPRTYGHKVGAENVEKITRACDKMGIKYLTIYAFSTENWRRPKDEVETLMQLLDIYLKKCIKTCKKDNSRVKIIGNREALSDKLNRTIDELEESSGKNTGFTLVIAINYGGRDELLRATKKAVNKLAAAGKSVDDISEEDISENLDTAGIPDPDLMIRTSGEERLSNFLPWQLTYSEFYFTDAAWPEFDDKELEKAVIEYDRRNRRFGGV